MEKRANAGDVCMTSNKELIGIIETVKNTCTSMATGGKDFSYEKYEDERGKILSYPELRYITPDWLIECRYGSQYWRFISEKYKTYSERRDFLRQQFDDMVDQIDMGVQLPISNDFKILLRDINNTGINNLWRKMIERSQSDPEGAVTVSKSLLEAVIRRILDLENVGYNADDDLGELYKKVKKLIRESEIKQITGGVYSILSGVTALRNEYGDAHGKSTIISIPENRHTVLTINLVASLCLYLWDSYKGNGK